MRFLLQLAVKTERATNLNAAVRAYVSTSLRIIASRYGRCRRNPSPERQNRGKRKTVPAVVLLARLNRDGRRLPFYCCFTRRASRTAEISDPLIVVRSAYVATASAFLRSASRNDAPINFSRGQRSLHLVYEYA